MFSAQLTCSECQWRTVCGEEQVAKRLRKLGLLRRAAEPPVEMLQELLISHGSQLKCDQCEAVGLAVSDPAVDEFDEAGDWQQAILCEVCRKPISEERLEFMPKATRCVKCQSAEDRGEVEEEFDYCPKCGSLMELRTSRGGGITRYKLFCTGSPSCRV
ncbi:TraR/DksA C4-type zinc finger protein [Adhaeretor mobilis]|uniref:Prokaryotic dksA/traR C4-type zinc finger n=1 Tax=Adhaeretor mobilis TaxID=1930276 RepID=A0A517MUU7_9BACT|nr:TraR/DksA C4-type zinc finger protein [Adhaeretor mobilis]QDS98567.1 Prokaryotic dksA/traR C4-type zinc finger [Adhaeretor mobilis]